MMGRIAVGGDTRSFEIELKNGLFCRVELNING